MLLCCATTCGDVLSQAIPSLFIQRSVLLAAGVLLWLCPFYQARQCRSFSVVFPPRNLENSKRRKLAYSRFSSPSINIFFNKINKKLTKICTIQKFFVPLQNKIDEQYKYCNVDYVFCLIERKSLNISHSKLKEPQNFIPHYNNCLEHQMLNTNAIHQQECTQQRY